MENNKVLWTPNPGFQEAALAFEDVEEKLLSGGRGSGKTSVGLVWLIHPDYINDPNYRGLVIRRQAVDLADWVDRAKALYQPLGAVIHGSPVEITFPSGAMIRTGHLADDDAYQKYQGAEFQRMLIEEATHIPSEGLFEKLIASCRSTNKKLPARILLTSNPDGPGRHWLKRRFQIVSGKNKYSVNKTNHRRMLYMHSTVHDNPSLAKDQGYISFLDSIADPELRAAWRDGDWDAIGAQGAYYGKIIANLRKQGRITNVPHDPALPVSVFWDLGIGDDTSLVFIQYNGLEPHVIDAYSTNGEALDHYVKYLKAKNYDYDTWYLPHDAAARELSTGRSREETLDNLKPSGVNLEVCPRLAIEDGIDATRLFLPQCWFDQEKTAKLVESLELYTKEWDDKNGFFKEKPRHDSTSHYADAMRLASLHACPPKSDPYFNGAEQKYLPPSWS